MKNEDVVAVNKLDDVKDDDPVELEDHWDLIIFFSGHVSFIGIWYIDFRLRDGGKSIEYFLSNVRKAYGLQDKDDGKECVEHLMAIYASLVSKGVPNVDRFKKAETQHDVHGSYIDLEPRGIDENHL
ncbi:hypothetical protein AX15_004058 [Amanita polypyramis BW_CC]|nr:hypothetical protein AX15_004058 [Amanita polypyramis BW_CC]